MTALLQSQPTGPQLKAARLAAELSQTAAATLVGSKLRTWQDWEAGIAAMPRAAWAIFLLSIGAHGGYTLKRR